jgi:alcohol dehydrogenase class IV
MMTSDPLFERVVEIKTPKTIIFGFGASENLIERLKELTNEHVLLVTDQGLMKAGVAEKIKKFISNAGFEVSIFDGVKPDPDKDCVYQCLNLIEAKDAKVLIGLGGGSSLDVAKVSAALRINGGKITDYAGIGKLPKKGLPTILMPTTSGTGSEVSPIAVISDPEQHTKLGIVSPNLYCELAIVDPALTISCPPNITASSGMDALTHAIEIYTNKISVQIIDTFALESIRLVGLHLKTCVHNGEDKIARTGMALASLYAGLGLGPVNTAAVHSLAYPLGGTFNIPHGLANSILLPYVMEFNRSACETKFAKIADVLGVTGEEKEDEKAKIAVEKIVKLSKEIGIPQKLREIGIPRDAIPKMAEIALNVKRLIMNNPRKVTLNDAIGIYERAY